MTRHPSDGTLRRLLDDPTGVADADREHVGACPTCLSGLAAARTDADAAATALAGDAAPDVEAGWRTLTGRLAEGGGRLGAPARPRSRFAALRSPAVAAVGVLALLGGGGVAAAADWFPIFRTERIAPVTLNQGDLAQLPDLTDYGTVRFGGEPRVREVGGAAAAERVTGLSVPSVDDLPQGVTGKPRYQVGGKVRAVFTFSADEAARTAKASGERLPTAPAGLDGSRFRLTAGPGFAAVWPSEQGIPGLVVARALAPSVQSSGVPFATARDYLLSLPGLPDDLSAQLRALSADGTTLPVPVPSDEVETSSAEVDGAPATVFRMEDSPVSGVVWVQDGTITAVAGSLGTDEVLAVAQGLR